MRTSWYSCSLILNAIICWSEKFQGRSPHLWPDVSRNSQPNFGCTFLETYAKTSQDVAQIFMNLVRSLQQNRNVEPPPAKKEKSHKCQGLQKMSDIITVLLCGTFSESLGFGMILPCLSVLVFPCSGSSLSSYLAISLVFCHIPLSLIMHVFTEISMLMIFVFQKSCDDMNGCASTSKSFNFNHALADQALNKG